MNCESCGMPMKKVENHGGGDTSNKYCVYCTYSDGKLKPKDEVMKCMAKFMMSERGEKMEGRKIRTMYEAMKLAEEHINKMPAWKG